MHVNAATAAAAAAVAAVAEEAARYYVNAKNCKQGMHDYTRLCRK